MECTPQEKMMVMKSEEELGISKELQNCKHPENFQNNFAARN
jgi:hypothetical protein